MDPPGTVFSYQEAGHCWDMEVGLYWGPVFDIEVSFISVAPPLSVGFAAQCRIVVNNLGPDDAPGIVLTYSVLDEYGNPQTGYPQQTDPLGLPGTDGTSIPGTGDTFYDFEWVPQDK